MLSKLIVRNSKKIRKDNSLFFIATVIVVIAFYIILSLSNQDVIKFLRKMESNAVNRLLSMIPIFYGFTLAILLFLVYFSTGLQMERRKHEFGVYLVLGMKRSKLFKILLLEDLRNSFISLSIGLPIAVFLSELISLIILKLVGVGIIGHRFFVSFSGICFTILGFLTIKIIVFIILSRKIVKNEIGELLFNKPVATKMKSNKFYHYLSIVFGMILLGISYYLGISGMSWKSILNMLITVVFGFLGTLFLFFGMRVCIEFFIKKCYGGKLGIYNFRQIQEVVIYRTNLLAMCSILIFSGLCFFGTGLAISTARFELEYVSDYTFKLDVGGTNKVKDLLKEKKLDDLFTDLFEVKIGRINDKIKNSKNLKDFEMEEIIKEIENTQKSPSRDGILKNFKNQKYPFLISQSSYNNLVKLTGGNLLNLKDDEVSFYIRKDFVIDEELINNIITKNPRVLILGKEHIVKGKLNTIPLVTDNLINISFGVILPDEKFNYYVGDNYDSYINGILDSKITDKKGKINTIFEINEKLKGIDFEYESYAENMGRQLFYTISASYITIYLSVIFLVIANTIIGIQFLMGQQKMYSRYKTLIHLGANYEVIKNSARKQINWYFGIPVFIAFINTLFGIPSLLNGVLPSSLKVKFYNLMLIGLVVISILAIFEFIYINIVKKTSDKYIFSIMSIPREE